VEERGNDVMIKIWRENTSRAQSSFRYEVCFSLFLFKVYIVFSRINCNARNSCTNSSGVKPDLGLDQDQQRKKHQSRPFQTSG